MRVRLLICAALLASVCLISARDIVTVSGEVYHNATVTRVEETGIAITHRDGAAFIGFADLPADVRGQFDHPGDVPDSAQSSSALARAPEITTLDGVTYYNITINQIEKTGIRVRHRDGVGFIDFLRLPFQLRRKYGYTEAAYAAGKAIQQQQKLAAEENQRRIAANIAAREAKDQQRREQAQASFTQQPSSIATRDYGNNSYTSRDYGADRYAGNGSAGGTVSVKGYYRKNGTYVHSYTRRK